MTTETATEHAKFSPSKMERIIECPGSLAMEEHAPKQKTPIYTAEGTAAHTLAQWSLTDGKFNVFAYQGRIIAVVENKGTPLEERFEFEADAEMCEYVQTYVDAILARKQALEAAGATVELLVEQRIDISRVIGVPEQFGTADAQLIATWPNGEALLSVEDLKYGKGVPVVAEQNKQLMTYGAGAYDMHSMFYNITRIALVIHMPRLEYVSEWEIPVADIEAFIPELKSAATAASENMVIFDETRDASKLDLRPGDKHCRFCAGKSFCPVFTVRAVGKVVAAAAQISDFDDLTAQSGNIDALVKQSTQAVKEGVKGVVTAAQLAEFMDAAESVEAWLKAVRASVEAELFETGNAPGAIPGYMLAEGRKGNRAWFDADATEKAMKSMRLKQEEMYNRKLISPAQAEKLLKDSTRRWNTIKKLYHQPPGKPSVVREDEPKRTRLVIKPAADAFDNLDDFSDVA